MERLSYKVKNEMIDYLFEEEIEDLKDTKHVYSLIDTLYRWTIGNPSRNCLSKEFKQYCENTDFEQYPQDFEEIRKETIEILLNLKERE